MVQNLNAYLSFNISKKTKPLKTSTLSFHKMHKKESHLLLKGSVKPVKCLIFHLIGSFG
ncbi:hypothetical protein D3C87_38870 [compost metagenome]